jgi:monovalent cation:H+ antiporter-2, CPA2 family
LTRQALFHLGLPATEILRYTDAVRRDQYAPLYEHCDECQRLALLQDAGRSPGLHWLPLERENPLGGRSIGELGIRTQTGVSVVGVMRNGIFHPNPGPEFRFAPEDLVAVLGRPGQFSAMQQLAGPEPERVKVGGFVKSRHLGESRGPEEL